MTPIRGDGPFCIVDFLCRCSLETKSATFCEYFFLSLIDCLITPKREGREVGGFDEQIFLWIESRILELVADESELTLREEEEVLRTTVVVARTELSELFCTDVVGFFFQISRNQNKRRKSICMKMIPVHGQGIYR